jgi:hypothetical protein
MRCHTPIEADIHILTLFEINMAEGIRQKTDTGMNVEFHNLHSLSNTVSVIK